MGRPKKAAAAESSSDTQSLVDQVNQVGEQRAAKPQRSADPLAQQAGAAFVHDTPAPKDQRPNLSDVDLEKAFMQQDGTQPGSAVDASEPVDGEEPAGAVAPETGEYPEYMLSAALQFGLDKADYSGPEALGRAILREADMRVPRAPQPQQVRQQQPAPKEDEFDIFDGKADEFDAPTKTALERLHQRAEQRLNEVLEKKVKPLEQANQQMQAVINRQEERRVDAIFDAVSPEFGSIFGNGELASLGEHTPAYIARVKVFQSALDFSQRNGVPVDSKLIKSFAGMMYGATPKEAAAKVAADSTTQTLQRRQGQFLAAPTQRTGPALTPEQEGIEAIRKFVSKNGHAVA